MTARIIPFPRAVRVGGMPALVIGPEGWHFTRCRICGHLGWYESVVPNAAVQFDVMVTEGERPCDSPTDGAA